MLCAWDGAPLLASGGDIHQIDILLAQLVFMHHCLRLIERGSRFMRIRAATGQIQELLILARYFSVSFVIFITCQRL